MSRISILSKEDAKEFDDPPMFDSQDRKQYFNLSESVLSTLAKLCTLTNKVCFLISHAYFKAKKRFYTGNFRPQDIEYVCRLLGLNLEWIEIQSYKGY